jgi:hypothetical protein
MTAPVAHPTPRQEAEHLVAQAVTRDELDADAYAEAIRERLADDALVECPVCGRAGLPERIVAHDCGP